MIKHFPRTAGTDFVFKYRSPPNFRQYALGPHLILATVLFATLCSGQSVQNFHRVEKRLSVVVGKLSNLSPDILQMQACGSRGRGILLGHAVVHYVPATSAIRHVICRPCGCPREAPRTPVNAPVGIRGRLFAGAHDISGFTAQYKPYAQPFEQTENSIRLTNPRPLYTSNSTAKQERLLQSDGFRLQCLHYWKPWDAFT